MSYIIKDFWKVHGKKSNTCIVFFIQWFKGIVLYGYQSVNATTSVSIGKLGWTNISL